MCFKSKVKTPKTNPDAVKAPEPVLNEEVKGVDFGAEPDDAKNADTEGLDGLKVKKSDVSDKGDGSSSASAEDTGFSSSTTKKVKAAPSIKKALKKVTK